MAAALAVGSMVFNDDRDYSLKLVEAAVSLFYFAVDSGSRPSPITEDQRHQSSGFHDEYIWASSFLYFATGNSSFLSFATDEQIAKKAGVFGRSRDSRVLSWDRKLPGAALLLRRLRVFINPGYPAEDMLRLYHGVSGDNACSYLRQFGVYNYTRGGMIVLNNGTHGHLQHVVNAVFTATLFADYLRAEKVPGWYCGPNFIGVEDLDQFARSQVEYLLGANPSNYSFIVGYGSRFPLHVHHQGASIPSDGPRYNCSSGRSWLTTPLANPHNITGAMVGGPDSRDAFHDMREMADYTEPTLLGNSALVAALVSITTSGGPGIDINGMFQNVPPSYPADPPPPPPWRP